MLELKEKAPYIGFVLGIVFLIIGLNYDNSALLILGLIFFAVGLFSRFGKDKT